MEQKRFPVFAERFYQLRSERGMSQEEFAGFLEITRPTVGFYENGKRIPDALKLRQIAEKCGVSSDWLLGLTDHRTQDLNMRNMCDFVGLKQKTLENLHSTASLEYAHGYLDFLISERELRLLNVNIKRAIWASVAYNHQTPNGIRGPLMMEAIADMDKDEYETWLKDALAQIDAEEERFDRDLKAGENVYIGFDDAASLFADRASGLLDGTLRVFIDDISFDRKK